MSFWQAGHRPWMRMAGLPGAVCDPVLLIVQDQPTNSNHSASRLYAFALQACTPRQMRMPSAWSSSYCLLPPLARLQFADNEQVAGPAFHVGVVRLCRFWRHCGQASCAVPPRRPALALASRAARLARRPKWRKRICPVGGTSSSAGRTNVLPGTV